MKNTEELTIIGKMDSINSAYNEYLKLKERLELTKEEIKRMEQKK